MKLLLMGAGYVGMALLHHLQPQPYEIFITTTNPQKIEVLQAYGKEVMLLGLDWEEKLKSWIQACDAMVVLVAPTLGETYEATYLGTAKGISSALKGRKKPFYLVYTSSTSVCEGQRWVKEEMDLCPVSEQAKILLQTEHEYLKSDAEVCVLRLGGIYGPQRELIDRARRMSARQMETAGDEPTNSIHLEDIVAAIDFCLRNRITGIYHLVNDDHRVRKELYDTLCKGANIPPPLWNTDFHAQGTKKGYTVSNQKIKESGFIFLHPTSLSEP